MITEIIDRIIEVRATNFPRNGFSFDTRMNYPVMRRQRRDTGKQTLEEITLAPSGGATDIASPGHTLVLVLDGRADVQSPGGPSSTLDARQATLLEPGASARLTNAGNGPARLLRFEITPAPQGG